MENEKVAKEIHTYKKGVTLQEETASNTHHFHLFFSARVSGRLPPIFFCKLSLREPLLNPPNLMSIRGKRNPKGFSFFEKSHACREEKKRAFGGKKVLCELYGFQICKAVSLSAVSVTSGRATTTNFEKFLFSHFLSLSLLFGGFCFLFEFFLFFSRMSLGHARS